MVQIHFLAILLAKFSFFVQLWIMRTNILEIGYKYVSRLTILVYQGLTACVNRQSSDITVHLVNTSVQLYKILLYHIQRLLVCAELLRVGKLANHKIKGKPDVQCTLV